MLSAELATGASDALRSTLDERGGREVKHTGDGIMASFPSAVAAVAAALKIQRDQATGGELLISSLLRELVASSGEFSLEAREPIALKRLDGEHLTHAVGCADGRAASGGSE